MFGLMKWINLFFSLLFLACAALQYNDADPYIWIPIYLFAAFLCWQAFRGSYYPRLYAGGIMIFTAYAAYFFFTENGVLDWIQKHNAENIAATMQAQKPWIEDTREFFGLVIIIMVLLLNLWYTRRKK